MTHTPDQSPGGIALWDAATGKSILGDILYDCLQIEDTYHADMDDCITQKECCCTC